MRKIDRNLRQDGLNIKKRETEGPCSLLCSNHVFFFFGVYRCSYLKLSKSVCLRVQKKRGAKVMGKVSQTASCSIRKESLEQIAFRNCIHCKQKFILNIKVEHSEHSEWKQRSKRE